MNRLPNDVAACYGGPCGTHDNCLRYLVRAGHPYGSASCYPHDQPPSQPCPSMISIAAQPDLFPEAPQ